MAFVHRGGNSWFRRNLAPAQRAAGAWRRVATYKNIRHYFLDMGGDSLLVFFEYPKGVAKADRDTLGAMQHVSFVCGPCRYREMQERLKANDVTIVAGPLLTIPPAFIRFISSIPMGSGWRSCAISRVTRKTCG